MDVFDDLNDVQQLKEQILVQRLLRDRQDPFRLFDEEKFIRRFKFRKATVLSIINLIALDIAIPIGMYIPTIVHIIHL